MRAAVHFPFGSARGGAEKLFLVLAKELVALGYEVLLFTDRPVDQGRVEADLGEPVDGIAFVQLPRPSHVDRLPTALAQWVIDLVHTRALRSASPDLFVNGFYKSRLPGVGRRNVLYAQFPYLEPVIDGRWRRRYVALVRTMHRRVIARHPGGFLATYDDVWANSAYSARHIHAMWGRSADILHPACTMHRPAKKEHVILSVGRFQAPNGTAPYKAQDRLIEAFARVHHGHPSWSLHLAGGLSASSQDADYFRRLREAASGLPVTFTPNASHAELEELFGRATIYWHAQGFGADLERSPEGAEHFGISTVEAMSAHALPLVFDAAGPAEVVEPLPDATWRTLDELVSLTGTWLGRTEAERAVAARTCAERARAFDRVHFRRRLEELLETPRQDGSREWSSSAHRSTTRDGW